uniref:Uncharacterized protein n=1 Tax=Triticum urartu TaxID=4572 RepID=A0A8R7UWN6_TRIUA
MPFFLLPPMPSSSDYHHERENSVIDSCHSNPNGKNATMQVLARSIYIRTELELLELPERCRIPPALCSSLVGWKCPPAAAPVPVPTPPCAPMPVPAPCPATGLPYSSTRLVAWPCCCCPWYSILHRC